MAEILTVEPDNGSVRNAWRSYKRLDRFYRMAIFSMMLFAIATPLITSNVFDTRQRAAEIQTTPVIIAGPTATPTPVLR